MLPHKLRAQVIIEVHKDLESAFAIFSQVGQNKTNLLMWIGNKLERHSTHDNEYIYTEPQLVVDLIFIQKGTLSFCLPRYADESYFKVNTGDIIGLEDFIYNLITEGETFREDKEIDLQAFETDDYGRRRFSVKTERCALIQKLNIFDF